MATAKLYNYFRSSASWRVRIALNWKQIPYEYVAVSLLKDEHHTAAFREINPTQAVPTLEIDGLRLAESMAVVEYLDETRPASPLLPSDPATRAAVRRIAEVFNSGSQPLQNLRVLRRLESQFGADAAAKKAWAAHFVTEALTGVELLVARSSGKCCFGDAVTLADIYLAPQLYHARRFGIDVAAFPRLAAIDAHLRTQPAFEAARPENQPDFPPEEK